MLSKRTTRPILALDWDARRLRVVQARPQKDGISVQHMLSVDLPEDLDTSDPQAMGSLVRHVLDRQKIRTDRVILDLPRDQVLLTTLKLPKAPLDELPGLVEFQIAKEIPFSLAEAVVDFAAPQLTDDGDQYDVLVGTVRQDVLSYYQQTAAAARLRLERVGLRPYANKVAVNELLGPVAGTVVYVDLGPSLVEIDVIHNGYLVFSRAASVSIPRELDDGDSDARDDDADDRTGVIRFRPETLDHKDRVVNSLLGEVVLSIEAYRATQPGVAIERIVMGGSVGVEQELVERLGSRFRASTAVYNPARQFNWDDARGREAVSFSAALGLVIGHGESERLSFDFLHPKKPVTERQRRMKKAPAAIAAAVLIVGGIITFYSMVIGPQRQAMAKAEDDIKDLKKQIRDLEDLEETIDAAVAFDRNQVVWIDQLQRLVDELPSNQEIVLDGLDMFEKDNRMQFGFDAADDQVAFRLEERLEKSAAAPWAIKADVGTSTQGSGKYPYKSSMAVRFERTAEEPEEN